MKHHWIPGNLPASSVCVVCDEVCGDGPGIRDFRCCWCQTTIHLACLQSYTSLCDFGPYKKIIVPPNCIRLKRVGIRGRRHFVIEKVLRPSSTPNWRPLIVVANKLSGNSEGKLILQAFRKVLNPVQVLDLSEVSPEVGLEWCHLMPDLTCQFLIAGGDGTVGWVLSAAESLKLTDRSEFGLLPLGTGNDLSRELGWGSGHSGPVDPKEIFLLLQTAKKRWLDRWTISIENPRHLGLKMPGKQLHISNYASIGVDALVTLNFHRKRSRMPRVLSGRLMNKLLFFHYGTKDVLERACANLSDSIELHLDGRPILDLPKLEGVVFLNIPFWGAGVRPWELGIRPKSLKSSICDRKMEIFGLYSSFHIAQMQVGLSEPYRIGQASEVKLIVKGSIRQRFPMQADGEPWLQGPAEITISHAGQVCLLASPDSGTFENETDENRNGEVSFF